MVFGLSENENIDIHKFPQGTLAFSRGPKTSGIVYVNYTQYTVPPSSALSGQWTP